MVAPLAVLAVVWGGRDWGSSKRLDGRRVRAGLGRLRREMPLGTLASGVILIAMGVLTLITAVTRPSMSSPGGRGAVTARPQHARPGNRQAPPPPPRPGGAPVPGRPGPPPGRG